MVAPRAEEDMAASAESAPVSKKAKTTYRGKQFKPTSLLMKWLVEPLLAMDDLNDWDALVLWWTSVGYDRFLTEGVECKNRHRAAQHLSSGEGITPRTPDGEEAIKSRFSSLIAQLPPLLQGHRTAALQSRLIALNKGRRSKTKSSKKNNKCCKKGSLPNTDHHPREDSAEDRSQVTTEGANG